MPIHCHKLNKTESKIVLELDTCFKIVMILTADEIEQLEGQLLDMQIKLNGHRRREHAEEDRE